MRNDPINSYPIFLIQNFEMSMYSYKTITSSQYNYSFYKIATFRKPLHFEVRLRYFVSPSSAALRRHGLRHG